MSAARAPRISHRAINFEGRRVGRLVIGARAEPASDGAARWHARCDCGTELIVRRGTLTDRRKQDHSCGCIRREQLSQRSFRHGMTRTPTWNSWYSMIQRCTSSTATGYADYGGRGIKVCDAWLNSFSAFLADMGERPAGKTIERRDPNGNYDLANCCWATDIEQANNKRSSRILTFAGESKSISQWARQYGLRGGTLWARIEAGWSLEKALQK